MVDLIGFAHSKFGKLPGAEVETLMRQVAQECVWIHMFTPTILCLQTMIR